MVTLRSKTDSCSMTGTGTARGSAGIGGARLELAVVDLLSEANNRGDLDEMSNCSLTTGSLLAPLVSSKIGRPVVEVDRTESPCLNLDTRLPNILYSSAVNGRASLLNRVTLIGLGPEDPDRLL